MVSKTTTTKQQPNNEMENIKTDDHKEELRKGKSSNFGGRVTLW